MINQVQAVEAVLEVAAFTRDQLPLGLRFQPFKLYLLSCHGK